MNYFDDIKNNLTKFLSDSLNNMNQISTKISSEILSTFEKYKKIGEEDNSEEARKIREGFNEFFIIIDKIFREFDSHLTEFLMESQRNYENIFQYVESFLKENSISELHTKLMEFSNSLKHQTPESILNLIQSLFFQSQFNDSSQNQESLEEKLNITFSESDTHLRQNHTRNE